MGKVTISVPGDKSITHRCILLSAIASGTSKILNYSQGKDCLASLNAIKQLGVTYESQLTHLEIQGVGLHGLQKPQNNIDCGNSGTTMRLLMGLLSGANIAATLVGDDSLSKRPMARVKIPLTQMGAKVLLSPNNTAPVTVVGEEPLSGMDYSMSIPSAQVKSAILFAGLYAKSNTSIQETAITRDHTENLFNLYEHSCKKNNGRIFIKPAQQLNPINYEVPGDFSAAAFWIVAGLIVPDLHIELTNVGVNSTRTGLLQILTLMGARIQVISTTKESIEPVANIQVNNCSLKGITIPGELVSLAIDEFPILFVAAACATGVTEIRGLAELRFKETDRISAMTENLRSLGILVEELPDGVIITGGRLKSGVVDSFGDHRIEMAMAIANLIADGHVKILNDGVADVSYPRFYDELQKISQHSLS